MEELYRRNNHENVMTWTKKQKRRNKNKDHSVSDLGGQVDCDSIGRQEMSGNR